MAKIDVSEILCDPDFLDVVQLIKRASTVNQYGEHVLSETTCNIKACVQSIGSEDLEKMPEGARLHDMIMVYYKGELFPERKGGYSDIIFWQGYRYEVLTIDQNFLNYGKGFTKAICKMENQRA